MLKWIHALIFCTYLFPALSLPAHAAGRRSGPSESSSGAQLPHDTLVLYKLLDNDQVSLGNLRFFLKEAVMSRNSRCDHMLLIHARHKEVRA